MTLSILVVAAHPDDEVLGCGGTIARYVNGGAIVHVAFMADGVFSRLMAIELRQKELALRRSATLKACEILGVSSVSFGDFPDNQMDTIPLLEIAQAIERLIVEHQPEIIFTHHIGDANIDHRRVHEAVVVACRPQNDNSVKTLLCFEVPSSTEWQIPGSGAPFMPNWFVDISSTLEVKISALQIYKDELRAWPHPRSSQGVESLARWRGATVGCNAAEAFTLGRKIE